MCLTSAECVKAARYFTSAKVAAGLGTGLKKGRGEGGLTPHSIGMPNPHGVLQVQS